MFEPRANQAIDCRVGSSRVILRFEVRAHRVENRVKKFFFRVEIEPEKQMLLGVLSKNFAKISFFSLRFVYFQGKHKKPRLFIS